MSFCAPVQKKSPNHDKLQEMMLKRLDEAEIQQLIDKAKEDGSWATMVELERELRFTDEEVSLMSDAERSSIFLEKNANKSIATVVRDLIANEYGSTENIVVASAIFEIRRIIHKKY